MVMARLGRRVSAMRTLGALAGETHGPRAQLDLRD
jgi:hypothetical protein